MSATVVTVDGVWKRYTRRTAGATLKSALTQPWQSRRGDRFWALQNVSLTLDRGDTLGVIGANGSGKSTLLRLVGGLGRPTRGRIERGRPVAAMMSLGQSFDPLLTGRENAVTAGILAGYTRKQALAKLDEIVEFAELQEFFDLATRTYSDGMRMRLAFSVAISVRPEILLIDEVLSVGDLRFQDKCFERLRELQARGCSIMFASHDEDQVRRLCNRVVWLAHGRIKAWGSADEVYERYRTAMRAETERRIAASTVVPRHGDGLLVDKNRFGTLEVEIADVRVEPTRVHRSPAAGPSPVRIEIDLDPRVAVEDPIVSISLRHVADGDMPVDVNTAADGVRLGRLEHRTTVALVLDRLDLPPGLYRLDVGVYEGEWSHVYDYHWQAYPLEVGGGGGGGFGPARKWIASRD